MRFLCFGVAALAAVVSAGCGDDDAGTDSGMACDLACYSSCTDSFFVGCSVGCPAGTTEGPPPGCVDGGRDAGPTDPPGDVVAEGLCENTDGSASVAVSPDGGLVAYIVCDGAATGDVFVQSLADRTTAEIGPGGVDFELEFSPDSRFLRFGAGGAPSVRAVDAITDAVVLSTDTVVETRFIQIDPSPADDDEYFTIIYSTRAVGGLVSIAARDLATLDTERVLTSDPGLDTSLELVSNSGQNIFAIITAGADVRYHKISLETVGIVNPSPFGPDIAGIVNPGLGNTHGAAHTSTGGLIYRSLDDDSSEQVLATSGVDPTHPVLVVRDATAQFLHFIVDGDPSRHLRDPTAGDTETLATADAWLIAATPDQALIVYPTGNGLFAVTADGSVSPTEIIADIGSSSEATVAVSSNSAIVATAAAGRVTRAPLDGSTAAVVLEPAGAVGESLGYSGNDAALLWQAAVDAAGATDVLRSASSEADTATTIAFSVDRWWPIPRAPDVLYTSGVVLRRLAP